MLGEVYSIGFLKVFYNRFYRLLVVGFTGFIRFIGFIGLEYS